MKDMFKRNKLMSKSYIFMMLVLVAGIIVSCDFIDELPEANSIADETPPSASFTFMQNQERDLFLEYTFANQSSNATSFAWDFGDGNTSTSVDPINVYPAEGSYTATLTVSDALGQTSTFSEVIEVVQAPEPTAITPILTGTAFDDFFGVCGDETDDDSRDCWRISGATIHQTTSNGDRDEDGNRTRAAKYPPGEDFRVSYQAFTVSPNQRYELRARYALEADGDIIRLNVIDGQLASFDEFAGATLLGVGEGTINEGNDGYNNIVIPFETGANGDISILFNHPSNADDTYIDNVSVVPIFE